jgi:serine/threonine-protein kinase
VKKAAPPPRSKRARSESEPSGPTLNERYVLGKPLGAGAVAEVRAADDTRLGREVAVKLLRPELADEPGARQRFEGEARAAAALAHPSIVQVFDVEVDDGRPYLVMERLPGRTLADEISRGPMDPARVIDVGVQVLGALAAAHRAGIVHRDVKPGNVLLAADGTWKVADFGIAKSTESLDSLTTPGMVLCTPGYVAPERLDGEAATPASDLYSVGVLLFEALAGRRPFVADTPIGVARLAQTEPPPRLDELRPGLDQRLVDIVHRALTRDPEQRFASALEMRDALLEVHDTVPERTPDDPTMPIRPAAGSDTQSVPTGFAPSPAPKPKAPKRQRRELNLRLITLVVLAVIGLIVVFALLGGGSEVPKTSDVTPTTAAPPATVPGGDSTLPAPLTDALEQLEKAVRP